MATAHIAAEPGDFAPAVLMPGDPKRAQRIAELLMPDAKLVTDVRGMMGFTGTVNGKPLSVMGSGMGMPSFTIYATELFSQYGVERIIRVGTCGAIAAEVKIGETIIGLGAHTDSAMNTTRLPGLHFSAIASFELAQAAVNKAKELGRSDYHVGTILSRDHFYLDCTADLATLQRYHVLGVEMEAAALYGVAAEFGKQALTVLTVTDHLVDPSNNMSAEDRETKFRGALELAVAAAHC